MNKDTKKPAKWTPAWSKSDKDADDKKDTYAVRQKRMATMEKRSK